jgi:hypothetical protein
VRCRHVCAATRRAVAPGRSPCAPLPLAQDVALPPSPPAATPSGPAYHRRQQNALAPLAPSLLPRTHTRLQKRAELAAGPAPRRIRPLRLHEDRGPPALGPCPPRPPAPGHLCARPRCPLGGSAPSCRASAPSAHARLHAPASPASSSAPAPPTRPTLHAVAGAAPARPPRRLGAGPPPGASRAGPCCPRAGPRQAAAPRLLPRTCACAPPPVTHGGGSPGRRRRLPGKGSPRRHLPRPSSSHRPDPRRPEAQREGGRASPPGRGAAGGAKEEHQREEKQRRRRNRIFPRTCAQI